MPQFTLQNGSSRSQHSKSFKEKLGTSKIISYEDLLLAQYSDEVNKGPNVANTSLPSPYLGRYTSLEEGLSGHVTSTAQTLQKRASSARIERRNRPLSTESSTSLKKPPRPHSAVTGQRKPKIDAKFIADPNLWDPATPREESRPTKKLYTQIIDRELYLSSRPKRRKPVYKRQPYIIRCTAFKNGDRDMFAYVAAPNVKQLLEMCTTKLELNGAARRIFLEDGSEVFETSEIPKDGQIYVSNGEAFRDPLKSVIKRAEQKQQLQWTMTGLVLPMEEKKTKKRSLLSKRFKKANTVNNRRVLVLVNGGQHSKCHEVVTDMRSFEDFLTACTGKLGLTNHARCIYDWSGKEITSLDDLPQMDACLQEAGTPVLGPVWVSSGGGFSPKGACGFLELIISRLKTQLKDLKRLKTQLETEKSADEEAGQGHTVDKDVSRVEKHMQEIKETLDNRKSIHGESVSKDISRMEKHMQEIKETLNDLHSIRGESVTKDISRMEKRTQEIREALDDLKSFCGESVNKDISRVDKHMQEIEETLNDLKSIHGESVDKDIADIEKRTQEIKDTLDDLKSIHRELKEAASKEEESGPNFTMQHIKELSVDDPAVGGTGLKLKAYRNGEYDKPVVIHFNVRQASRGIDEKNKRLVMERLLDLCASRLLNPSSQGTKFARLLYDCNGDEIKEIHTLKTEQEIWLSMGEPFRVPYILCLQIDFENVRGVTLRYPADAAERNAVYRAQHSTFEDTAKSEWEGSIGFPFDYNWSVCDENTMPMERDELLSCPEVDIRSHYLVHRKKRDMVLYPELVVSEKKKRVSNEEKNAEPNSEPVVVSDQKKPAPHELLTSSNQLWVLTKEGYILSRCMPLLVLAVLDARVDCKVITRHQTQVTGHVVGLQKRQEANPAQQWLFTKEGLIYSKSHAGHFLTYVGSRSNQGDEKLAKNEVEGLPSGLRVFLAVCEKISGKDSRLQRFGLKQEKFENLGQWKNNDSDLVNNPEYNKLAYSWPIKANEELNEKFDWPMEFYFIAQAPPICKAEKAQSGHIPLRLLVMKNGEVDTRKATPVVGPDLTNMKKDLGTEGERKKSHKLHSHDTNQHHSHVHPQGKTTRAEKDDSVSDFPLHCDELTFRELEFRLFLERCTGLLNLPFAARRLFDADGREQRSLAELKRDQLVFVTCGEVWSDPQLSKAEQQRRHLLASLASDIAQIRQFCALRDTEGYVLEVEGMALPNVKVVINHCAEMREVVKAQVEDKENHENQELIQVQIDSELYAANSTAHDRSHMKLDGQSDRLKWPWERLANEEFTDLQESPRRSPSPNRSVVAGRVAHAQKFVCNDGYIELQADHSLVLGVIDSGDKVVQIGIVKKKKDDTTQLWIFKPNATIQCRAYRDLVLSVSMPTNQRKDEEGLTLNYCGCTVILQRRKEPQFGSANQKWRLDEETGYLYAFHTNHLDVEISAANKANVCTYAVTKEQLDQPGYAVNLPTKGNKSKEVLVCTSCARAMRGRYKLNKIPGNIDFHCAMGRAKDRDMKMVGSFQCLNGKVDLSTFEAINTLDEWETKYNKLWEESSVRLIAKQLAASEVPPTVKIYAYKNGEGRQRPGQLIVGSSLIGLLDQCTYRLNLTSAARRLYMRDGTTVLDIDDLIGWAVDHYSANVQEKSGNKPDSKAQITEAKMSEEHSIINLQYQVFTIETEADGEGFEFVNPESLEMEYTLLEVEGKGDHHICLLSSQGTESIPVYEIILGRSAESAIIIYLRAHLDADNAENDIRRFPALPSSESKQQYWLSWADGKINLGTGLQKDKNIVMSVDNNDQKVINYIAVASPEAPTKWKFHVPSSKVNSYASEPAETHKLIDNVQLDEDVGSKGVEPFTKPITEGSKVKRKPLAVNGDLEPPPLEVILQFPVEVWVSAGEPFSKPDKLQATQEQMKHYRQLVAQISRELQMEKHKLRHMQGRRLDELNPGQYESTGSSIKPVVLKNSWQDPSYIETVTHDKVNSLKTKQNSLRVQNSVPGSKPRIGSRLYSQSTMKRVLAYANGESVTTAQYVWGDSLDTLLQNATARLHLRKPAKCLYTPTGGLIDFTDLQKDQIVCVSAAAAFICPKDVQQEVQIRANWGRTRKHMGPDSTNVVVSAHINSIVDVDPFGPPSVSDAPSRKMIK